MQNVTEGKLDTRILVERDDEIGVASRNMQTVQAIVRFNRDEVKNTERRAQVQRKSEMARMAKDFENEVGEMIENV